MHIRPSHGPVHTQVAVPIYFTRSFKMLLKEPSERQEREYGTLRKKKAAIAHYQLSCSLIPSFLLLLTRKARLE